MNPPSHDIELIERYFDNELNDHETMLLKDRLKKDFEFQKLFDREKLLITTVRLEAAKKDLEFLKGIEKSIHENNTTHFNRHWLRYAAAACLSLIALVLWKPWASEDPQALFAAYVRPYPNIFEPVRRGDSELTARALAFQAYEQEDYTRASSMFAVLAKEDPDPGVLMLLGNSNLQLGKTAEARQNFLDLMRAPDVLKWDAQWYLSLCALKDGDLQQAKKLLEEISRTENAYSGKAREILRKLR